MCYPLQILLLCFRATHVLVVVKKQNWNSGFRDDTQRETWRKCLKPKASIQFFVIFVKSDMGSFHSQPQRSNWWWWAHLIINNWKMANYLKQLLSDVERHLAQNHGHSERGITWKDLPEYARSLPRHREVEPKTNAHWYRWAEEADTWVWGWCND